MNSVKLNGTIICKQKTPISKETRKKQIRNLKLLLIEHPLDSIFNSFTALWDAEIIIF